jgi:hypothetical protein
VGYFCFSFNTNSKPKHDNKATNINTINKFE